MKMTFAVAHGWLSHNSRLAADALKREVRSGAMTAREARRWWRRFHARGTRRRDYDR